MVRKILSACAALAAAGLPALAWGGMDLATARAASLDPLRLHESRTASGVDVSGENTDPDAVRWVWVALAGGRNVLTEPALPQGFVLQPLEKRFLFSVRPDDATQGYAYEYTRRSYLGDPNREPDKVPYLLPYAHGTKHTVTQGYFGKVTHQGIYALDFDMPDGTQVCAARAGVVVYVKQDSDEGGMDAVFNGRDNQVLVQHADGTWAVYTHLMKDGALVQKGQQVEAGEPVGLSGHTGLASGPHLHFEVDQATWDGPRSIPTVFQTGVSSTASIVEGRTYYSWHPGGAPFTPLLAEDLKDADFRSVTRPAQGRDVSLRYERVDRSTLVWADNATAMDLDLTVSLDAPAPGIRASAALPLLVHAPAGTEVYCFRMDPTGSDNPGFDLRVGYETRVPAAAR